jgi:hypothetical protein
MNKEFNIILHFTFILMSLHGVNSTKNILKEWNAM